MAQSIVLKRSALSGKVPGTSSLSLGEVAINTYDGRVFFKKSGSIESIEHILTTNSVTTGSITLTKTGSFGEIVVSQDGNFQRDIFVTRDIVGNGDLDVLGSLTASLSNGYVWVGNGSNRTTLVATSSFGGALTGVVQSLVSKTGSYATTGSNNFVGNQTIAGKLLPSTSNLYDLGSTSSYWRDLFLESTGSINFVNNLNQITTTITSTDDGGVQIGSVVITTSSILFVDDQGNTTQTVAQSSSAGQVSNFLTTSSFQTYTSSVDNKFTTLQNVTASLLIETSNLETFSSSTLTRLSNLESTSASLNNTEYRIFTGSISASVSVGSTIFTLTSGSSTYVAVDSAGRSGFGGVPVAGYAMRVYGSIWANGFDQLSSLNGSSGVGSITFYDQGTLAMNLYGSHAAETVKGFFTIKSQDLTYTTPTSVLLHADTDFADHPTMIIRSRNTSANSIYFQNYHYASGALFVTQQPAGGDTSFRFRPGRTTESFLINSGGVVVNGTSVVSGSMRITGDLTVLGSASFQTVSSSVVKIGDNQIILNTFTPTIRFGGISVIDSGSSTETGSLWWDSQRNHWLYEHPSSSAAPYNSAILISGPYNNGALGDEVGLTSNRLTLAVGEDHISSSQIYVDNTTVAIPANLQVTGSFDLRNAEFNATSSNSSAGNVLVSQNQTGSYISAFYNYAISSGSNMRAGQIMSIWSGSVIRYTEVTTTDIGSTANVNFSASINAGNVLLHLSSSGVWNVRSIVNLL